MGSKNRKEKERQIRRDDIITAAEQLFFDKGFHGTTLDEIAEKADFTKMTLYSYFENKEEIFFHVVLKGLRILNGLFEAATLQGTGFDKVTGIGAAYRKFFQDHRSHFRALSQAKHIFSPVADTPLLRELERENARMFATMGSAIETGIKDGTLRDDIEPEKLALLLASISEGFYRFIEEHKNNFSHHPIATENEFLTLGLKLIGNAIRPLENKKEESNRIL
jgi:TetR/AcrR family transcriptional regulator